MRYAIALVFLSTLALAEQPQPTCLIIKHASAARQAFVSYANWQYVAGDFPPGMKWKGNVGDKDVRKVKERGGKVITLSQNYSLAELESAKQECSGK